MFELHIAGLTVPSHWGAVPITLQPPRQRTLAPQLASALPWILQSPVHVPLHVPSQCAETPPVYVQLPLQRPLHLPAQVVPFAGALSHCPVHMPAHDPSQWTVGCVAETSHSPLQSAEHDPVQFAAKVALPSQTAFTAHEPPHTTLRSPGSQDTVTSGGVQLVLPVHVASQFASASAATWQPPPVTLTLQMTCAPASAARIAVILFCAWAHASWVRASSVLNALQVSVTLRSLSMDLQAL
jgi:hypothetical protein